MSERELVGLLAICVGLFGNVFMVGWTLGRAFERRNPSLSRSPSVAIPERRDV